LLPILIVVSGDAGIGISFARQADTVAAARISPESPNDLTTALMKFVVKEILSAALH